MKHFLLILLMSLLLFGCTKNKMPTANTDISSLSPETEAKIPLFWQPGQYLSSGRGHNGEINLSVRLDESKILSIEILNHTETEHIFRAVETRIPEQIVAAQSLAVDVVAGATLSRLGIITAVEDCIKQAGGDVQALYQPVDPPSVTEDRTIETQVLVVGSGMAGLSAGIESLRTGADVLIIEKLAVVGGSSSISGGKIQASESFVMKEAGIEDTAAAFKNYLLACSRNLADPQMIELIAANSGPNIQWLADLGVSFLPNTVSLHEYRKPDRGHLPQEEKGYGFTVPMENYFISNGGQILTETTALSLIFEDNIVKGVQAKGARGEKVTILADAVILATGGFDRNADLMAEYQPLIQNYIPSGLPGSTGDGLLMAKDIGAAVLARPGAIGNCLDVTFTYMTNSNGGSYQAAATGLFVAGEGERFVDENEFSFARTAAMLDYEYTEFYSIFDQNAYVPELQRAIDIGRCFSGDTLAELAEKAGLDESILTAAVNRYNTLCENGFDEDFGKPGEYLTAVADGPFYALLHSYVVSGTFGGLMTDLNGCVLNEDGLVIKGLYAAGEVANGQYLCYEYPGSGGALISYLTFGRIAGEAAGKQVLQLD